MIKKNSGDNLSDIMHEPLAIVGINCQFPGVNADIEDVDAFYEMLIKEQTSIKEVPANRWDIDRYYDIDRQKDDKIVSRKGGFLNDPRLFDAAFFEIAPIEAKQIDPQYRLFLEVSIRALNHANISLDSLKNSNTTAYTYNSMENSTKNTCSKRLILL
ncbi:beta-ketoacyl synthase N-terminal-like domain-containing protein [Legionella bozemanae]|uniref:beta-ketoacyl synthase N-terminal-like domain-containing protein n=1 Tax=Legionella bozemanae TaxID=447 RepID=UPI00399CB941